MSEPGSRRRVGFAAAVLFALASLAATRHAAGQTVVAAAPRAPPQAPSVTDLRAYIPFEVAPGAPNTHPLALAGPGDRTISPGGVAEAQAYSDQFGGKALLVWQGGKLRYEHYAPGVDQGTRFETFSMHKSVLGLVYGAAIRDRVIGSLDDEAGRYLPEWRGDARGRITLRQILSMASGLHLYSLATGDVQAVQMATGSHTSEIALASRVEVPPGTRFEYNNANSQVAGVILNRALKAAGRDDYATYVSHVLLRPLGMGDAHLWLEHEGGDPRFFAHFEVTARDWVRVGMLIAGQGRFDGARVLPAAWLKSMVTPSAANPNYGLQVWLGSPWTPQRAYGPTTPFKMSHLKPYLVDDIVFFDGFGGERVYVSPSLDLVIVRIGDPDRAFDDSIIPNAVIGGLRRSRPDGTGARL